MVVTFFHPFTLCAIRGAKKEICSFNKCYLEVKSSQLSSFKESTYKLLSCPSELPALCPSFGCSDRSGASSGMCLPCKWINQVRLDKMGKQNHLFVD